MGSENRVKMGAELPKDRTAVLRDACLQLNDIHSEVQQLDYLGHNFISRAFEVLGRLADSLEALK